jgi:SWI/SNF chromatin-remodeling complex subunit SWI1
MQHQQPPLTPQQAQQPYPQASHNRNSMSRSVDPAAGNDYAVQSPVHVKTGSVSVPPQQHRTGQPSEQVVPRPLPKSDDYTPCAREISTWGGVDTDAATKIGEQLEAWRPDMPHVQELGNIDIPALTRSLQCGIHGEVRLALDTLAIVSNSPIHAHFLQLAYCDDLVDVLVDLAEEQLDMLTENTVEVSDEIQLNSYEDQFRFCQLDKYTVREEPVFGTKDYDLDRAVDRLLCITAILRNVSFPGDMNENHHALAEDTVMKLFCSIIRYLGTRTMLLRSHANTLDFMKDMVVLLSNIAGAIELASREHAFCFLHFLLAFAPMPGPSPAADGIEFQPYKPSLHTYLPHAIDALAKLLARDEPNRTHFKTIFALDAANNPAHELLTRTFALAVSPIPTKAQEQERHPQHPPLLEMRKPFLMQGLLSADILASLAPNYESGLVRTWLSSSEGQFAPNLFRIIRELSRQYEAPQMYARNAPRGQPRKDPELVYIVMVAVSLLRRLAEKARDPNTPSSSIPSDFLPSNDILFEATTLQSPEWTREGLLQQLTSFYNLAA